MELTIFLLACGFAYTVYRACTHRWQPESGDDSYDTDNENPDLPWEEGEYHL